MVITGLHLLLTYQCTLECDHCFVWSSPRQSGAMTLAEIRAILEQGDALGSVRWVYLEGGEPFLYHPILVQAVRLAAAMGFRVGVVSNAYWATSIEDARAWLEPMAGCVEDLSLSSDRFHGNEAQVRDALAAATALGIPGSTISVVGWEAACATPTGQLPAGESGVMYRGRAAVTLAAAAPSRPWESFTECPYEDLREPGRVHIDPLGWVHLCQGIALGNVFQAPLREIFAAYNPDDHPIAGPLLAGGPAELTRRYSLSPNARYADACHLCYESRARLRLRFPGILVPDQLYGCAPDA